MKSRNAGGIAVAPSALLTIAPRELDCDPIRNRDPIHRPADNFATTRQTHISSPTLPLGLVNPQFPSNFGRYKLLKILGEGGMGLVYLAHDARLDRQVAIKIPKLGRSSQKSERFEREARAMANLRHPNICPVYDVGVIDGTPFLTMAYVAGETLADYLAKRPRLSDRKVATWIFKLAHALQAAHSNGVIHRDLKPANIIIDANDNPVVMDFGLAKLQNRDARLTNDGAIIGTPAYMPPEQVSGIQDHVGPRSDIYSLGVIMYEMLSGRLPYEGSVVTVLKQIVFDEPLPPSRFHSGVDERLETACLTAMAKSIDERFSSAGMFAQCLRNYLTDASQHQSVRHGAPNSRWIPPMQVEGTQVPRPTALRSREETFPRWLVYIMPMPIVVFAFLIVLVLGKPHRNTEALPKNETVHAASKDELFQGGLAAEPILKDVASSPIKQPPRREKPFISKEASSIERNETVQSESPDRASPTTSLAMRASEPDRLGEESLEPGADFEKSKESDRAAPTHKGKSLPESESDEVLKAKGKPPKKRFVHRKPVVPEPKEPEKPKPAPVRFVNAKPHHHAPPKSLDEVFRELDQDRDGLLAPNEVPVEHHDHMVRVDANRDGKVTRRELGDFNRSFHPPPPPRHSGQRSRRHHHHRHH